jgi:hypothetical protein
LNREPEDIAEKVVVGHATSPKIVSSTAEKPDPVHFFSVVRRGAPVGLAVLESLEVAGMSLAEVLPVVQPLSRVDKIRRCGKMPHRLWRNLEICLRNLETCFQNPEIRKECSCQTREWHGKMGEEIHLHPQIAQIFSDCFSLAESVKICPICGSNRRNAGATSTPAQLRLRPAVREKVGLARIVWHEIFAKT